MKVNIGLSGRTRRNESQETVSSEATDQEQLHPQPRLLDDHRQSSEWSDDDTVADRSTSSLHEDSVIDDHSQAPDRHLSLAKTAGARRGSRVVRNISNFDGGDERDNDYGEEYGEEYADKVDCEVDHETGDEVEDKYDIEEYAQRGPQTSNVPRDDSSVDPPAITFLSAPLDNNGDHRSTSYSTSLPDQWRYLYPGRLERDSTTAPGSVRQQRSSNDIAGRQTSAEISNTSYQRGHPAFIRLARNRNDIRDQYVPTSTPPDRSQNLATPALDRPYANLEQFSEQFRGQYSDQYPETSLRRIAHPQQSGNTNSRRRIPVSHILHSSHDVTRINHFKQNVPQDETIMASSRPDAEVARRRAERNSSAQHGLTADIYQQGRDPGQVRAMYSETPHAEPPYLGDSHTGTAATYSANLRYQQRQSNDRQSSQISESSTLPEPDYIREQRERRELQQRIHELEEWRRRQS